jgi:hypothetical protein
VPSIFPFANKAIMQPVPGIQAVRRLPSAHSIMMVRPRGDALATRGQPHCSNLAQRDMATLDINSPIALCWIVRRPSVRANYGSQLALVIRYFP